MPADRAYLEAEAKRIADAHYFPDPESRPILPQGVPTATDALEAAIIALAEKYAEAVAGEVLTMAADHHLTTGTGPDRISFRCGGGCAWWGEARPPLPRVVNEQWRAHVLAEWRKSTGTSQPPARCLGEYRHDGTRSQCELPSGHPKEQEHTGVSAGTSPADDACAGYEPLDGEDGNLCRWCGDKKHNHALPTQPTVAGTSPPRPPSTPTFDLERELRLEWWFNHGCPTAGLYGDDGEMQCGACGIDFRRMPITELLRQVQSVRLVRAAKTVQSTEAESVVPDYDPIRDERKPLTLRAFAASLRQCATQYEHVFDGQNEFHKQSHTWSEWLGNFAHYMSW